MKAEIKLYTNSESKNGFPVVAYFRGPGVCKHVVISKSTIPHTLISYSALNKTPQCRG